MNIKHLFLLFAFLAFIQGCSSTPKAPEPSGFLENYESLEQVPSPEGTLFFTHENPAQEQHAYHAVIIEPVYVYQNSAEESNVTRQNIERARVAIDKGLHRVISNKYTVTQKPGPGVMRLKVAITGAEIEAEGFKPWNIIPVSAAITLAAKATDLDSKKAVLVVELKFTDSQSKALIKETVTAINSDNFRQSKNSTSHFETLAESWAEQAMPIL